MTIFTDADTVASKTTVSAVEVSAYVEAVTIATKTTVIPIDRGPYSDASLIASVTSVPTGELEYMHPTGQWGPFDTDSGQL